MPLDPRISLMGTGVDVGGALSNAISNMQKLQSVNQNNIAQPLQNRLMQQNISVGDLSIAAKKQQQKEQSMVDFSFQVGQFLERGDVEGAKQFTRNRASKLSELGIDSSDTLEFSQVLESNPEQAKQLAMQGVEFGRQKGLIGNAQLATAAQRERQSLLAVLEDPNASEDAKNSARVALGILARAGSSSTERILGSERLTGKKVQLESDIAGGKEEAKLTEQLKTQPIIDRKKEELVTEQQGRRGAIANANKFVGSASENIVNFGSSNRVYKEAIAALEGGANSGQVYSLLPSLDVDSILLDNIANRAGFELAKSGGGIITDADMRFGLKTAIPQNLPPEELKAFLQNKVTAQDKIVKNLRDAVNFLDGTNKTISDWYKQQKGSVKLQSLSDEDFLKRINR